MESLIGTRFSHGLRAGTLRRVCTQLQTLCRVGGVALVFGLYTPMSAAQSPPPLKSPPKSPVLLIYGDSLGSGYGLPPGEGFAAQLQEALRARGNPAQLRNASVAGETSAGGLARLNWTLDGQEVIHGVLLELGANDALRGIDPEKTERNLDRILDRLTRRRIPVLLAGMRAPLNMGGDYTAAFDSLYPRLARKYDLVFYPFFLDGVAIEPTLNQSDGRHPNRDGVARIVARILPSVETLVGRAVRK